MKTLKAILQKQLEYLDLTKNYPYQHFCGNAVAAEEIYIAQSYAKNYMGLKNPKNALKYLLPNIIDNGLADNNDLIKQTVTILKNEYGKEKAITLFNDAKNGLYSKKETSDKRIYNQYYISFGGDEIKLQTPWDIFSTNDAEEKELMKQHLEESQFNKLLNEL